MVVAASVVVKVAGVVASVAGVAGVAATAVARTSASITNVAFAPVEKAAR